MAAAHKINVNSDDRGLKSCYSLARIQEDWAAAVADNFKFETLEEFMNYQREADPEETLLIMLNEAEATKDHLLIQARFKTAYQTGSDAIKEVRSAAMKGASADDLEDPMPLGPREQLDADWQKCYSLLLEPYVDPADSLRGRVWREFRRRTSTVVEAKKMKSILCIAHANRHDSVSLPGGVKTTFDSENNLVLDHTIDYYFCLRTLANTWAFCGNYMMKCASDNTDRKMMRLSAALAYPDQTLRDCMEFGQGDIEWFCRNDVTTRGPMYSLIRQGWSAESALAESRRIHALDWRSPVAPVPVADLEQGEEGEGSRQRRAVSSPLNKARAGPKLQTVSMARGGKAFCKPWNDERGCRERRCPGLHKCDVRLNNGKVCEATDHNRQGHVASTRPGRF